MSNIVKASFGGTRRTTTRYLYQYDYGQKLVFTGLDLPDYYTVHFSNTDNGASTTSIGDADGVLIPDHYLATGMTVYAWVFLHTGSGDGETRYTATIPVSKRPTIEGADPTPAQVDVVEQAIEALNGAISSAGEYADTAARLARDAEAWAAGTRDGAYVLPGDETFRNNAKYYAELAQQALQESGYIVGELNENGELVIEVVGITGLDVNVLDEEVVVIYE